jgi:uncharacterized protein YndB with AHSA1/START domain
MCTIWYMPKPVSVSIEVPDAIEEVFAFLDVMANHERFTNHLMHDWEYTGPDRGIGSKARVKVRSMGVEDTIDIEVVAAEMPRRIVERNRAHKSGRVGQGTYTLSETANGGTLVVFTYEWLKAPVAERVLGPVVRAYLRRYNAIAMRRLAGELGVTRNAPVDAPEGRRR